MATPGEEGELPLPRLEAQQHCGPPQAHWLRFTGEGPSASAISLELSFEVHVVAGPPSAWSVSIVDGSGNSQAAAAQQQHHDGGGGGGGGPNADAASGDLSHIQCGKPFFLEIEAVDQYNNRCGCDCFDGPLPTPRVLPQAEAPPEDGVSGLVYDPSTWQQGWDMSQPRGPVFVVRLSLGGTAAPVKLMVRDECGPSGGTSLCEDCLPLELSPGPAAMLAFEGPNQLACGTRGLLGELHVRACDAFGNVVEAAGFEVLLQPAAIATDGSGHAAKVNAAGTNRVKLKRGVAVLRDVRINAEQAATYAVRVASATRKVVVADGQLLVAVAAQNYVTALALLPGGLPAAAAGADGAAGAPTRHVGSSLSLVAQVTTEDGEPLPYDVAAAGMTLRLTFPNTTGGSGGGDRIESVALSPECGKESCPAPNLFVFSTAQLTLSGTYTVTLVYVESRQELARTMPKQEQSVRSTSHALEVLPGRAAQLTLEGPSADASHVAVTNGPNDKARCLLRGAAVQVRDAWGNACPLEGMPVRWALLPRPTAATTSGGSKQQQQQPLLNGEMPVLACAEEASSLQANTDSRGRAYFGDLVVKEGSGRVDAPPPGSTSNIMLLELRLEAQGLGAPAAAAASKKASATGAAGSWGKAWSVTVAFSDDAARAGALQALMQQKDELRSQGRALKEHRAAAEKAADVARRDHKRLIKHAEKCAGELPTALRERFEALGGVAAAGGGAKLAAQLLDNVKGKAATGASSQPSRPHVVPRYGKPNTPSANAIQRCLTSGDPHVVGVFAELGQIDDPLLNQQLSSCVQGSLSTLVTSSFECIERLRAALQAANMYIPSMLSTTHINPFTPTGYPGARRGGHLLIAVSSCRLDSRLASPARPL